MRRKVVTIVAGIAVVVGVAALVAWLWVPVFVFPPKDRVVRRLFVGKTVFVSLTVLSIAFYAGAKSLRANHPIRRFAERLAKELTAIWRS
jgi:hypothetical protein